MVPGLVWTEILTQHVPKKTTNQIWTQSETKYFEVQKLVKGPNLGLPFFVSEWVKFVFMGVLGLAVSKFALIFVVFQHLKINDRGWLLETL